MQNKQENKKEAELRPDAKNRALYRLFLEEKEITGLSK